MYFIILSAFLCSFSFSQNQISPLPSANGSSEEVIALKQKISDLEEITKEHSEIIKRQIKDQHFDQSSRGYIELKYGLTTLDPKDVEDNNDEVFNDLDDANWEKFDFANILDLEIGKTVLSDTNVRHEFGVGYQHLRSKRLQASFSPSSGGGKVKITETALAHTLYGRYSVLFQPGSKGIHIGPGITFGYSPTTKLLVEAEQGNEGAQVYGEGTSFLIELFGKAKIEMSRYFYLVSTFGYRMQEAENLKLNAAEIVSVKTRTDLDLSGVFATFGIAASF